MKLPIHQSITSKINIKWKKLKSFVTRVFTIITRCFIASTRSFNLPTRAFSLATCAFNLLTRGFELLTREFELVIRRFELVTREFELVTRTSELLTHKRNSCFTFPRFLTCSWHCKHYYRQISRSLPKFSTNRVYSSLFYC